ncbi:MAG: DVU_1553 family AMP-dependent CoA ligase [Bacillota bacterium]|jgi:phenylacetate-CoA ligase
MIITPLDQWIDEKIAGQSLATWQLHSLNRTLQQARNSAFYRKHLPFFKLDTLRDLEQLPLMSAADIIREDKQLICVHQSEISRIVSLFTSGSTDDPKRIYFTCADQELTLDFFARGMPTLVKPYEKMAVLMPCERRDGLGDLICRALKRIPVEPIAHGLVKNLPQALEMLLQSGAQTLVGVPIQILALARYSVICGRLPRLHSVLLSADSVPKILVAELKRLWGCEVFQHFGMTETGLGGAIDCSAHQGYHMREADLYFEVIDPATGVVVPAGQDGEVVFTTLTREGMPLIRYRSGDISAILEEPCPCGSKHRRLEFLKGRMDDYLELSANRRLRMTDLDEMLLPLPQVMDFSLQVKNHKTELTILTFAQMAPLSRQQVKEALGDWYPDQLKIITSKDIRPLHKGKRLIKYI